MILAVFHALGSLISADADVLSQSDLGLGVFCKLPHGLNEQSGLHDAFSGLMLVDNIPAL